MRDPITELLDDLDSSGKPSLAWTVRWSAFGIDPVAAAWQRSWTPADMTSVLRRTRHPMLEQIHGLLRAPVFWTSTDVDAVKCDAIRRLVPVPPALRDLLSAGYCRELRVTRSS